MALTHEDVVAILKIIDESPYDEVRLEIGDLKLHVRRNADGTAAEPVQAQSTAPAPGAAAAAQPAQTQAAPQAAEVRSKTASAAAAPQAEVPEGVVAVRAPMLGTFYRAPAPGEPPFVEVGSKVHPDDTVCLVEVMKLFNSVKAGTHGTVVKIAAENGSMVEHGQVLILIEADRLSGGTAIQ